MRRVIVIDPLGFNHALVFAATHVDGANNLTHGEPHELRHSLLKELLARIQVAGHGTYRGYRWEESVA